MLDIYVDYISAPSRAVLLLLKTQKVEYKENIVQLAKGEHKSDRYKKINPFGLVPALVDDSFALTESSAILRYIATSKPMTTNVYPSNQQSRARVDEYLSWHQSNIRKHTGSYFKYKIVDKLMLKLPIDENKVTEHAGELNKRINELANIWLKTGPYMAGGELTLADIQCITELIQVRAAGFEIKENVVLEWIERVRESLAPHFDDMHRDIEKLCATLRCSGLKHE
ncbi:unnamed protein product [Owenia fusiformis]|uniref:Glutathione transferase n=1 Tax=Owenia fusiformis TaxID=6347 RepID=A0A8S4PHT2_OWEFU|nr:unnamed protein product [Owenia fusiformis]